MQKHYLSRCLFCHYTAAGIRNPACQSAGGHRRGSGKVKPNQAKLTWNIEARADVPASAMAALSSKTALLLAALEAFGLPKEDLASSVLSLSPNFQYIDRQPSKLLDYSAITRLEVTINHLPAFPEIVQIGLDPGVTALGNLGFLTKDEAGGKA